jgi:hypothetical protein
VIINSLAVTISIGHKKKHAKKQSHEPTAKALFIPYLKVLIKAIEKIIRSRPIPNQSTTLFIHVSISTLLFNPDGYS